jgi:adenylosuccinate synthase
LDELDALGIDVSAARLKLAAAAHVILPTHRALDGAREMALGETAIGTTRRGIGPTYSDKAARTGLRLGQMDDPEAFAERVREAVTEHNRLLEGHYGLEPLPADEIAAEYCAYAQRLRPYLVDGTAVIGEALAANQTVLCDHGTYPYVTSSSPTAGGALTGLGFGPRQVEQVVGVVKAYTTRVGSGPFPTELTGAVGDRIREVGGEFGTTTGRPRRCGWLDLPIVRYAARVNGLTELALTKLDVLSGVRPLQVAVAYERQGRQTRYFPAEYGVERLAEWSPIYQEMTGWDEDLSGVRRLEDLPPAARAYAAFIEEQVGVPITLIGVGPQREQVINVL